MKKHLTLERAFEIWSWTLMAIVVTGISVAIFNLATGNYCATASFEF